MNTASRLGSISLVCVGLLTPGAIGGQPVRGGFIARLGTDTVHIERFVRDGNQLSGTILQRTPVLRVIRWSLTLDDQGTPVRYEARAEDAAGAPILNGATGTMDFSADTIVRTSYRNGQAETHQIFAPNGAFPSPGLPYIGVSYLSYELGFAALRRRLASGGDTVLHQLTLIAGQQAPSRTRAWVVSRDSAELSYFGVARSGYRFDGGGRLVSADWTSTTYRYLVERIVDTDLDPIARSWGEAEQRRSGFGALSPRDSTRATVGTAQLTIDYSRPAVRGRPIWGGVVPWNRVWRLGADMATHFTTDVDLTIGGTAVPAGRYTLWMLPSETAPKLIVSRSVNVFGTAYDPAKDLARIALTRQNAADSAERLTLAVRGGTFVIHWADVVWSVPVVAKN